MDGSPLVDLREPAAPTALATRTGSGPAAVDAAAGASVLQLEAPRRSPSGSQPVAQSSSTWYGSSSAAVVVESTIDPLPEPAPEFEPASVDAGAGVADLASPRSRRGSASGLRAKAEPPPEESLIGLVLGERYHIDERIGGGGMGVVYRATHVLIGKAVAVKVLRRRHARMPEIAGRFMQEARVASSIKHPNVVDISDYGTTPEHSPYYVMELLPGHSLGQEIRSCGKIEPRRAVAIACAVARGLAAAHAAGIVHRDLKPDNVFLTPATAEAPEQIKILDFGIARDVGLKARLTITGSVVGTPEYMSPEQARAEDVDGRADLYALGVLLYEALCGELPLRGDTQVSTMTKQVFEVPPPLRQRDPSLEHLLHLEAALLRLLAKDRRGRPATALDAVRLLEAAVAEDLGVGVGPGAAPAPETDRLRKRATIFIGSGSVTNAHRAVEVEGPATGSFAAKAPRAGTTQEQDRRRPSIIIRDGEGIHTPAPRPSRILAAPAIVARDSLSPTPTPTPAPRTKKRKRSRRARRRQVALLLMGVTAAIVAAVITVLIVFWLRQVAATG